MILFLKKSFRFIYFIPRKIFIYFIRISERFLTNFKNRFFITKAILLYLLVSVEKNDKNTGSLWSKASWSSVFTALIGSRFNLNHLGSVYIKDEKDLSISQKIEKKVIEWNKKIIYCNDKNVEGYVTSGGTEANLFLMWAGREFLKKNSKSKPILLVTDFAHYSIQKSGRILDIGVKKLKIDRKNWGMSLADLEKNILSQISKNKFSFLLPITIGYSSTGASDPLDRIVKLIKKLKKNNPRLNCFMWVDAAAQGLPKSFLETSFSPLSDRMIQGYVVDFHKYGKTSLPAGVVLYKKQLRKLIETPISYLIETDSTILGSRPGSSALAIWANIVGNNTKKWKKRFIVLEKRKKYLIEEIKIKNPKANILSFNNSLTFAVEINSNFKKLSKKVENEQSLVRCDVGGFQHYKFHAQ